MKNYVLVGAIHVNDNWYGQNYRIILKPSDDKNDDVGYSTKKEVEQYLKKFKEYCKTYFKQFGDGKCKISFTTSELENLIAFTYVSMGPSLSYTHYYITPEELVNELC